MKANSKNSGAMLAAYKVNYEQNQHLLDALINHAEDLGYRIRLAEPRGVNESFPILTTDDYVDTCALGADSDHECEAISVPEFFRLTKEDVQTKPPAKKMTMAQINAELGYDVEVVE